MSHNLFSEINENPATVRDFEIEHHSRILPFEKHLPYPRFCAHRGCHTAAPENTIPAFDAAVTLGAEEIEFDLWSTTDGELVSAHDSALERVSNGTGMVFEHTLAELKALDFGSCFHASYKNLRLPTFEEILQKFARSVIMNIHVKIWDAEFPDRKIEMIASLLEKYDCVHHIYFMSTNTDALLEMRKRLPHAGYCQGSGNGNAAMVEDAIKHSFDKVQFASRLPYDKTMIDRCHAHGIRCNCRADTACRAKELLRMGIDCIMTDDYRLLKAELERLESKA